MQNFGRIKNSLNDLLVESIGTQKNATNKTIFKDYIRAIKENEILKTQFLIFNNIENRVDSDLSSAMHFVQENVSLMHNFKPQEIAKANEKLVLISDKISKTYNESYDFSELHDSLGFLISTKKTAFNIDEIKKNMNTVANFIVNNPAKVMCEAIDLPKSMVSSIMVDKYNERYADLTESEKKILRIVVDSTDDEKKQLYKDTVKECISLINDKLKSADLDIKEHLLSVKDRLLDTSDVEVNLFEGKISKLINLRSSLIND